MTTCGICNTEPSKYKCPTCEVPYCSLVCYKPHKAEHQKSELDSPPKKAIPIPTPIEPETTDEKPNDQKEPIDSDIFAPLLTSPEVQRMLASPSLRRHLLNVHKATLEPPPGFTNHGRGRGRGRGRTGGSEQTQQRPWNAEKGTKAGVEKLRRLREDNTEVDEFVNVVVGLIEKDTSEE